MQASISRLEQMARNPRANWAINDVQRVCEDNGVSCEPPRGGGSHYKCTSKVDGTILMIPRRRPIKPVYIRLLVGFIRKVWERQRQ
jgi:hypothetical protein